MCSATTGRRKNFTPSLLGGLAAPKFAEAITGEDCLRNIRIAHCWIVGYLVNEESSDF